MDFSPVCPTGGKYEKDITEIIRIGDDSRCFLVPFWSHVPEIRKAQIHLLLM